MNRLLTSARRALALLLFATCASAAAADVHHSSIDLYQGCGAGCAYQFRAFPDEGYELRVNVLDSEQSFAEEGRFADGTYARALKRLETARYTEFRDVYAKGPGCVDSVNLEVTPTRITVTTTAGSKQIFHGVGCRGFERHSELVQLEDDLVELFELEPRVGNAAARLAAEAESASAAARKAMRTEALAAAATMFDDADSVELLSLDSADIQERHISALCQGWCYFGWPVLGSVKLTTESEIAAVRDELRRWRDAPEPEFIAMCFTPRHGVRVRKGGHVHDYLICYQCGETQLYADFERVPVESWHGGGSDQDALDALFRAHGVRYFPRRDSGH